jgi:hypothetical protein
LLKKFIASKSHPHKILETTKFHLTGTAVEPKNSQGYFLLADSVETSINNDVLMVCFANMEDEDEPSYLVLQRYITGDASASKQAVYIELNEQSSSCYGGIEHVVLEANRLHLHLNSATSNKLGLEDIHGNQIDIQFTIEEEMFVEIQDALQKLFADHLEIHPTHINQ